MGATQIKRNVDLQIGRNPSTITITRTSYTDDGAGGKTKSTSTLNPQHVRVFLSASSEQRLVNEGGQIQVQRWGMLAKSEADIKPGDTFTLDDRQFRVMSVFPARTEGQTVAFHADLEEVR